MFVWSFAHWFLDRSVVWSVVYSHFVVISHNMSHRALALWACCKPTRILQLTTLPDLALRIGTQECTGLAWVCTIQIHLLEGDPHDCCAVVCSYYALQLLKQSVQACFNSGFFPNKMLDEPQFLTTNLRQVGKAGKGQQG